MKQIEKIATIAILAGVGLVAAKNWGALTAIGSKASTAIGNGLNKLAGNVKDAAKE